MIPNSSKAFTITENNTVAEAWDEIKTSGQNELVVVDLNNNPKKVLTVSDIVGVEKTNQITTLSGNLSDVNIVNPNDDIEKITINMPDRPFTVVLDQGRPSRIIRPTDLANYWKEKIK